MVVQRLPLLPHSNKLLGAKVPWCSLDKAVSFEQTQRTNSQDKHFPGYFPSTCTLEYNCRLYPAAEPDLNATTVAVSLHLNETEASHA